MRERMRAAAPLPREKVSMADNIKMMSAYDEWAKVAPRNYRGTFYPLDVWRAGWGAARDAEPPVPVENPPVVACDYGLRRYEAVGLTLTDAHRIAEVLAHGSVVWINAEGGGLVCYPGGNIIIRPASQESKP